STIRLRIGMLGCAWMIAAGCTSEDGEGMGDTQGADGSSGTSGADSTMSTTMNAEDTLDPHTSGESDTGTSELGTSSGGESTGNHDGSETGSDVEFDEEFEWVAEFLR